VNNESNRRKSKIISLRIPLQLWNKLQDYCRKNNYETTSFVKIAVHDFITGISIKNKLDQETREKIRTISKKSLIKSNISTTKSLKNLENDKNTIRTNNPTVNFNFRINSSEIEMEKIWQEFCKQNDMKRTELIVLSLESKLDSAFIVPVRDYDRVKSSLNNFIRELGLVDFNLINTIFDTVHYSILLKMLSELERNNFIITMQKGQDEVYVSTEQPDGSVNVRRIVDNFYTLINGVDNESLLTTLFNYLETSFKEIENHLQLSSEDRILRQEQIKQLKNFFTESVRNIKIEEI
jgi:hypothetical protein